MSKVGNYQIPFDKKGNQQHYGEDYGIYKSDWRDNFEFEDTLAFVTYSRGRSAAYFHFQRSNGTGVTMFLKDLTEAIPHFRDGALTGRFTFTKRGDNFGVRLIRP